MPDLTLTNQLHRALLGIVPAEIVAATDCAADDAESFAYPEEGRHMENAVTARRNEFIAGRRSARAVLSELGQAPGALPPDEAGVPAWPAGTVGSISHSRGLCCAVAASTDTICCLGLDLEKTTRLSPRAMERVLHPLEADFVGNDQAKASLLFSVKEAFFKAQFPRWHAQPNFKDLALHVDVATKQMSVREIAPHLPEALREATRGMQFRYRFFGDYVVTLCWL